MQLKLLITAVGIVVTLFIFQNCGKAGFDGQATQTTDESSTAMDVDPKFKNLPFPYDISVNQIAFTNCNNPQSANVGGDFTVKVGAFDNTDPKIKILNLAPAGVSLSADFVSQFDAIANKAYIKDLHSAKLKEVLSFHPLAYGMQPYLGFREQNAPRTGEILYDKPDSEHKFLLGALSQSGFMESFVNSRTTKYHFFPQAPAATQRYLEGALSFPYSSLDGNTPVSTVLNTQGILTVGFFNANKKEGSSNNFVTLMGPDTSEKVFGRGFYISNTSVANQPVTSEKAGFEILEERDLVTGATPTTGGRWDCSRKFKIVAEEDRMNCVFKNPSTSSAGSMISTGEWNDVCKNASKDALKAFLYQLDNPIRNNTSYSSALFDLNNSDSYIDQAYNYMEPACPPMDYNVFDGSKNGNAAYDAATYHLLRRFLPADNWDINVKYKCVVPKKGICYDSNAKRIYDERFFNVFPTAAGVPGIGYTSTSGSGPNGTYISKDYKTNPNVNFSISGVEQSAIGVKHPDTVCTQNAGGGFECAKYLTMCVKVNN